jgi:hypothetical protein
MTGFGRAKNQIGGFDVTVEIKSVNHRYFEFSCRMPRAYNFLEEKIKSYLNQKISRGKVEVSILVDDLNQNSTVVEINREYADAYIKALSDLSKQYKLKNDVKVSTLANNPEVFKVRRQQIEDDVIEAAIMPVLEEACENFIAMRSVEGERLLKDVVSRTDYILSKVDGAVAVRFQVPEAPDFGNNVKVEFPEGAFIDIYGNASEAWSQTVLFAYDYKLEDIYGYFVGNATSYIYGDGLTMIATEASDDAEKGNVKITNFMTWPCAMYANFDPQAGTLTIEDWQLVYKPNETMALMFATNSDAGEPLVLHMYKKGVLSDPSIWAGLYLDAGADSGWYDIFSDMTLNWQAEDPMGGGVAPAAAKTLAPVKVGPKKF